MIIIIDVKSFREKVFIFFFRLDLIFTRLGLNLLGFFLLFYFLQDFIFCALISGHFIALISGHFIALISGHFIALISGHFIGFPHAILGKKRPRNPKHRILFPVTFFPTTSAKKMTFGQCTAEYSSTQALLRVCTVQCRDSTKTCCIMNY